MNMLVGVENIGDISRQNSVGMKKHELRDFKLSEFIDRKNVRATKKRFSVSVVRCIVNNAEGLLLQNCERLQSG